MLDDIFDHVVIDDPFLLLEAVHQTLLTDTVDHTGDPRCYLENFIQKGANGHTVLFQRGPGAEGHS